MLRLVLPSVRYKKSYLKALKEFKKVGMYEALNYNSLLKDFGAFIRGFKADAAGKNLPRGIVPQTTYWLVDGGDYIGSVRIRHCLNRKLRKKSGHIAYEIRPSMRKHGYGTLILQFALPKARKLGISCALLTCDSDNIASKRVIEKSGGIFRNSVAGGRGEPATSKYLIDLTSVPHTPRNKLNQLHRNGS